MTNQELYSSVVKQVPTEILMAELEKRNVKNIWFRDHIECTARNHVGIQLSEEQISEVVKELSTQACIGSEYDLIVEECIGRKFLDKANYWVLAEGLDCDGYNSGRVRAFITEKEAQAYADNENDFSDGIIHVFTSDSWDVHEYCNQYGIDFNWRITHCWAK